jgi:hypothetical protein
MISMLPSPELLLGMRRSTGKIVEAERCSIELARTRYARLLPLEC